MKRPQIKKMKLNFLSLAFALPCVGMLIYMIIGQCEPFGSYSMLY